MASGKGNLIACDNPDCKHNTGDHQQKVSMKDGVILKRWRGVCNFNFCNCQLFVRPENVPKVQN